MDKKKLNSLLVSSNITLKQAMSILNETGERILFVVDDKDILKGTLTDGDIRRGLINGFKFSDTVGRLMCKQFISILQDEPEKRKKAQTIMRGRHIEQIPVLDERGRIIDAILWTDIFENNESKGIKHFLTNPVVIMAGGEGARLEPFTRILPKPLIPVGGKTIIEIIMEKFYNFGFCNFMLTLNYKKDYIKVFIKENKFPYKVDWVEEEDYMGTAGSLSLLKDKIKETFIVSNCDIIVDTDYTDILKWHREHNNLLTLIGCHKQVEIPYGILDVNKGLLKKFVEKPNYEFLINTGVYVLEPQMISLISKGKRLDMNKLIEMVAQKGKVSVYPIHDGWFDIGQWEEYHKTVAQFGDGSV